MRRKFSSLKSAFNFTTAGLFSDETIPDKKSDSCINKKSSDLCAEDPAESRRYATSLVAGTRI